MELQQLTTYAKEKYGIEEEHKWVSFPGFSVLCHPRTGKWLALLMRQWDTDTGVRIERCDLKASEDVLKQFHEPWLSRAVRMRGASWVGIAFRDDTDPDTVYELFDKAVTMESPYGYTMVLSGDTYEPATSYGEITIPVSSRPADPRRQKLPEKIAQMRRLFRYERGSARIKAKNFYLQAKLMEDYEDDTPWRGDFICANPTYQDLSIPQLRGYFNWRSKVRHGTTEEIPVSAAYIYIYELLNGIGLKNDEEVPETISRFMDSFREYSDAGMQKDVTRWLLEFSITHALPAQTARQYAEAGMMEKDDALAVLKEYEGYSDEELFKALCAYGAPRYENSPAFKNSSRGIHLVCEAWRLISKTYKEQGKDFFERCFGRPQKYPWKPLFNAVYYQRRRYEDTDYALDGSRVYRCRDGEWHMEAYDRVDFNKDLFRGFLRETDRLLRQYLKTGHALKASPADAWADPLINEVIRADEKAVYEAAHPPVTIDLSGLEKIREDASFTRDSLLTEDDLYDPEAVVVTPSEPEESEEAEEVITGLPLDPLQVRVLRMLLKGQPVKPLLEKEHVMPSLLADQVNEAFYDEIGDIVLNCEDDELSLVEDYMEDVAGLIGGKEE